MKRFSLILAAMMLLGCGTMSAWQGDVAVQTPNTQLVLHAYEGGDLRMGYYGNKSATLQQLRDGGADLNFSALPAFGTVDAIQLPAIQVQHADGDLNLELKVTDYQTSSDDRSQLHIFTMTDKLLPVTVKVFYKAYRNVDVIETWTEISHKEKRAITLKRFDSGHLTLRQGDVWISHLHGNPRPEDHPQYRRRPQLAHGRSRADDFARR